MLNKNPLLNMLTLAAVLMFVFFMALAKLNNVGTYIPDVLLFLGLTLFLYLSYDMLQLTIPLFTFFVLSLALHSAGMFGWYAHSPLPLSWDKITHFFPIMAVSMIFFSFLQPWMEKRFLTLRNLFLISLALLAGLGAGSLVENVEYFGFSVLGFGEGGFYFGAGDAVGLAEFNEQLEINVGGWFNAMADLVVNLLGALAGVLLMMFARVTKPDL